MKKIGLTGKTVRFLGRTGQKDEMAYLAWSLSGVEFSFCGCELNVTFRSSDIVSIKEKQPHIVIFVDGIRTVDTLLSEETVTVCVLKEATPQTKTIKIVKASEAVESTCVISELLVDPDATCTPTKEHDYRIEVIGDSITCGYGVNGTLENTFSTGLEDATKAYAYLAAESLSCDISVVAMSGHGIISGYTEQPQKNTEQLVMPYYKTYGKSLDRFFDDTDPAKDLWDFKKQPDLIIINLGTNDTSWCKELSERADEFTVEYVTTLKTLRALNPKAKILCVLGIMYQTLFGAIQTAVETYRNMTGDGEVYAYEFALQSEADGYAVDWHPSEITQKKAGKTLAELVKERFMK